jgi:glycine hydroxymethyltransferase
MKAVSDHDKWRTTETLNLIPSENFASDQARHFLSGDLSNRYTAPDNFYRGTRFTDEVEALAVEFAKKVYRAKFADVRPLSGHTCSLILFVSFLEPGDTVVTCPPEFGGYPGSSELGLGPLLRVKNVYFPYDPEVMNIRLNETRNLLERDQPDLTIFGSSFIPFPYDIKKAVPENYGGITAYDGSHVMGLIGGGEFQQPLKDGCSLLVGSTHKTLFGPQGGLIVSDDEEVFSTVKSKIFPGIVDNFHPNRVASLAYALLELLRYGEVYAKQVVRNSKVLAKALDDEGVPVKCSEIGYTKSHQVLLGFDEKKSIEVANRFEQQDIITDVGIRLGTSEVTRRGMKEKEMETIASLLADSLKDRSDDHEVRRRVHGLVKEFSGKLEFTF